ncbi:MAG: thiamine pyrophosphate-dependent enzyme [Chloroflexota bacterium]
MADELGTYAENTWCPGCGNFGILTAFKKAVLKLEERGTPRQHIVMAAGIGQHAKIFDYLALSGFYSIHGRALATAQGMKLANPRMKVVVFVGDGDAYGEGIAHLMFAAKRNSDITVIVHNNGVYALTTGQYAPTSAKGFKGPSTPEGSVEEPFNPLALVIAAGAGFVARGYPVRMDHLVDLFVRAIMHEGFSLVDVLQPCVTFNNTFALYNEKALELDVIPGTYEDSLAAARRTDKALIGVFREVQGESFHGRMLGDRSPVDTRRTPEERQKAIAAALG